MKFNSILTPPTLSTLDATSDRAAAEKFTNTVVATLDGSQIPYTDSIVVSSLEYQIERMVANCAIKVWVTNTIPPAWGSKNKLKTNLPPSYRNIIGFTDTSNSLWSNIESYLDPIYFDLKKSDINRISTHLIVGIFWPLYLLANAARLHCEVYIDPVKVVSDLNKIQNKVSLSPESKARINRLIGLFSLFHNNIEVQSFVCRPTSATPFRDRLEEILEDTYLLEASTIRKFFGIKSNIASLKRDLRSITNHISKHSKWAKGIINTASSILTLPDSVSEAMDAINSISDISISDKSAPVLLTPKTIKDRPEGYFAFESLKAPYRDSGYIMGLSSEYAAK